MMIKNSYLFLFLLVFLRSVSASEDVSNSLNKGWQGGYVSGSIGSVINKSDISTNHTQPYVAGMTPGGYNSAALQADRSKNHLLGFQLGYNWTHNNYLWGLEADYSPSKKSNTVCNSTPDSPRVCGSSFYGWTDITSESKYFGALKARFGYILSDFMFHVNFGYAYIENSNLIALNCPEGCGPWDGNIEVKNVKVLGRQFVPTYGLGVEYLLNSKFRLGIDYQLVSSNQLSQTTIHDSTYLNQSINSRISNQIELIRLKLTYAF